MFVFLLLFWRTICVGHSFNCVFVLGNVHDRNAGYFPYSILQITIVCCHNVAFVLSDSIYDAVVGVGALMQAGNSLEARIFHNFQSHFILLAHFLQFGHDAIGNVRNTFGVQAIHHILNHIQLILDAEMHEICID